MLIKLFLVRTVLVDGQKATLGFVPPERPVVVKSEKKEEEEEGDSENEEPEPEPDVVAEQPIDYEDDLLTPASDLDTLAYYAEVQSILPNDCYWFAVRGEVLNPDLKILSGCIPIRHFGIGKFFSGRKNFRLGDKDGWARNGGAVWKLTREVATEN